jgi:hypothetical protein
MAMSNRVQEPSAEPLTGDQLADAIKKISDGMTRLTASGLNRRAIIVLLQDHTSLSRVSIRKVLDGLAELKERYTT